ncbi:hypothetical protein [Burkholderia vietnamiensis]|uniref:hypothetical protein n=1 Tax=Burkholderia vietnamiensis TaxID=60552 RepID=UPI001B9A1337|nr:hypothetical protein [Burkholderia vietnamiensis]MBR7999857.1 hypothetical protein [Burkholderia vietnamiensis]
MKVVKFEQREIEAFMKYLASHHHARREMLVACGLQLEDVREDEVGETPAALAEASSETICECRPDLVLAWLADINASS